MVLIGWKHWVLRLFKNFRRRDSLRGTGIASNYLWWEDMGKEQMSVATTKENKHCEEQTYVEKF